MADWQFIPGVGWVDQQAQPTNVTQQPPQVGTGQVPFQAGPITQVDPSQTDALGQVPPRDVVNWGLHTGLKAAQIGAGFLPGGLPLQMGVQGLLGGAEGALEGDAMGGAIQNASMEGIGNLAGRAIPPAFAALGAFTGGMKHDVGNIVEAFMRNRQQGPRFLPLSPGDDALKASRQAINPALEAAESGVSRAQSPLDPLELFKSHEAYQQAPMGNILSDAPFENPIKLGNQTGDFIDQFLAARERDFGIPYTDPVSPREMLNIGRSRSSEAGKLWETDAGGKRRIIPGQQLNNEWNQQVGTKAKELGKAGLAGHQVTAPNPSRGPLDHLLRPLGLQPQREMSGDALEMSNKLEQMLADLHTLQSTQSGKSGLGAAGIRGGLVAGALSPFMLAGGMPPWVGGTAALLATAASPKNASIAGHVLGRGAEAMPTLMRSHDLVQGPNDGQTSRRRRR